MVLEFLIGLLIGLICGACAVMWLWYLTERKEHRRLVDEKKNRPVAYDNPPPPMREEFFVGCQFDSRKN